MALSLRAAALGALLSLAQVPTALAAEIKCACAEAIKPVLAELGPQFERATGHKLVLSYEVAPVVKRQVEAGEAFDLAILNPPQVDDLIKQGKLVAGSRADLGRAGLGIAVRAGAPKPDISTVDAFKRTLLNAQSVTYPEQGTSGAYFISLLDRLKIAEQMRPKLRPAGTGAGFGIVARGEAEMMMTVIPQFLAHSGIDVVGPLPSELQSWIGLAAGIGSAAKEAAAASDFVKFLKTPAALSVWKARGWDPLS
jgi:molybdate transport system substrate-binding protein